MTDKKILLLALLFLAGCASDPMEESGGKEAPATAMRKIVNAPANAARGELLIYFDGDAVGDVEQTAAAAAVTRTAATRSGIAPVDDIFTQLGVASLRRVFPCNPVAEERTRAAGLHKWYIVTFDEEVDLDAAARRLAAVSEVSFVQFNTKLQLASDNRACPYRGGSAAVSAEAIKYAADNGASILQCSWGYPAGAVTTDNAYASGARIEKQAIDYFIATKNNAVLDGGLVIFAAGNDAKAMSGYPGAYRDYISVTAFSPDYLPAYYTNYGPGCNVAAPGGDAYISPSGSSAAQVLSTLPSELYQSDYGYMQGTSMACPHVSGVAALGLSYALAKGKQYTVAEFKSMLLTSVNDIDTYLDGTKQSLTTMQLRNYRKQMGTGAIDAYQLLMQIEGTPCLKAKVGVQQQLSLDKYFGKASANLTYLGVEISQADRTKLGISAEPTFVSGKLRLHCTKPGVARITVRAVAGGSGLGTGTSMGGMEIAKEFAVIARAVQTENGGWL